MATDDSNTLDDSFGGILKQVARAPDVLPLKRFHGSARYELVKQLGAGGFGIVYEAYDKRTQTAVALKTLRHMNPMSLSHLKNEFRVLQDLVHPNLCCLGELTEEHGDWFFTMELVQGTDFVDSIRTGETGASFCEARLRESLSQIAQGLAVLHDAGRIHRDVKPSNVLVTDAGRVVLVDFGLVTEAARQPPVDADTAGTAAYMAPEQAARRAVGPAADCYAVGVMMFEALTGLLPFRGTAEEILLAKQHHEAPRPSALLAEVDTARHAKHSDSPLTLPNVRAPRPSEHDGVTLPEDLEALCCELLRRDPNARPSARDICRRVASVGEPTAAPQSTSATTAQTFEEERHCRRAVRDVAEASPLVHGPSGSTTRSDDVPFVGRDAELGVLRRALADSRCGTGVTVVVQGESGIGKSELIRRFLGEVEREEPDAVILAGRCYERESVPYKALDGVVDALTSYLRRLSGAELLALRPDHAYLLPRVFPVLAQLDAIAAAPRPQRQACDLLEIRTRAFGALRQLLSRLGQRKPLVVSIDDLQWADVDSRPLLRDLLQKPHEPQMLLIVAARPPTAGTPCDAVEDLQQDARRLTLGAIAPAPAEALVRTLAAQMSSCSARMSTEEIAAEANGHPLFIQELVRHARADAAEDEPWHEASASVATRPAPRYGQRRLDSTRPATARSSVAGPRSTCQRKMPAQSPRAAAAPQRGPRLDEAIWARILKLDEASRRILELTCLVDAPVSLPLLRRSVHTEPGTLFKDLATLRHGCLVRTTGLPGDSQMEPYHDRVRQAVLSHLDDAAQVRLHRQLAHAMEHEEAPAELLLRHWELAGEHDKAARCARDAAQRASATLAFDRAAHLWQRALQLHADDPTQQPHAQLELARALANAGRGPEAAKAFLEADASVDAADHVDCQRQAAEQWLVSGHIEAGVEALDRLLRELGAPMPRSPVSAFASLAWQRVLLHMRGFGWKQKPHESIDPDTLRRLDVYEAATRGLAMVDYVRAADYQTRALLLALRAGDKLRVGRALVFAGPFHGALGSRGIRRARKCLAQARTIAEAEGSAYLLGLIASVEAFLTLQEGRLSGAADMLAQAEASLRDETEGTAWELSTTRILRLLALRMQGKFDEVARLRTRVLRDAHRRGDVYTDTTVRRLCVRLRLAADDPAAARRDLDACRWVSARRGAHLQHFLELEAEADISLYVGDPNRTFHKLLPRFADLKRSLWQVKMIRAETRSVWGRMWLALGEEPRYRRYAVKQARGFARQLETEELGYIDVLASVLRAGCADAPRTAIAALEYATEAAEAAGMAHLAAAARHRLGALTEGAAGARLTEQAEATLRADGVVNVPRFVRMLAPGFFGVTRPSRRSIEA